MLIIPIFALLYFLSAWIMASLPLNEDQPKGEITLFLVSNGVHTDVVMPLKNDIFDWSDVVNPKDTLPETFAKFLFPQTAEIQTQVFGCFHPKSLLILLKYPP
ncbi:DUF2459 domain-containing protein [Neisseria subflava]|uniref:DUF2459 domain-containing protein n=1 Tax=Neisseria subflava TaxID=28449 RepID=UPI0020B83803|nr:DUF2459 domain-containing protein [Neisseria subflava]